MIAPTCRSCGGDGLETVFAAPQVPVENSRLYSDAAAATAVGRGDLLIQQCRRCGFVQNSAFDPALVTYDDDYEAAQGHSPFFREFSARVIAEMIHAHGLQGGRALEIGCGGGDFLRQFCAATGGTGIGIDPAVGSGAGIEGNIELRADQYGAGSGSFGADVVICRHTLEHVPDIAAFLTMLRAELSDRPEVALFLEIPDSGRIAGEAAFWDVYYEHCSYLDEAGFVALLRRCGFDVAMSRLDFAGQYLVVHATLGDPTPAAGETSPLMDFDSLAAGAEQWRNWADDVVERDGRVAVWAASSKAVAFLSTVPELEPVVAVDINPAKAGRYLPGSALLVCEPDDLPAHRIDTVLVMNPVYIDEIREQLEGLGIDADLVGLGV